MRLLDGAHDVLAAHGPALPQPDQLCGPFAAWAALHAVLPAGEVPSVVDLARAAGTRVWPYDVPAWRPCGAPLDRSGWDVLPDATTIDDGGTDAAGLAAAITTLGPQVEVVPAHGPGDAVALLGALLDRDRSVGVLANLRTGPVAPSWLPGPTWDVGHFVVLLGLDGDQVLLADSYAELGAPGLPAGCRLVEGAALATATAERGLMLLVDADGGDDAGEATRGAEAVARAGFVGRLWGT